MQANILRAIINISTLPTFALDDLYAGSNRVNNTGDALEYFVKDMFCSSIGLADLDSRDREHARHLSYRGNQNNPPDFILQASDAVEVKKVESVGGGIQLNSSYPKAKLYRDDSRINADCRACDGGTWADKDIVYCVGSVIEKEIKLLWFVYGDCYAASKDVYERVFQKISAKVHEAKDIEFTKTNEIAGVRRVDPLGITNFRVRGMWSIESPHDVFGEMAGFSPSSRFSAYALMLKDKFDSFPKEDREAIAALPNIKLTDVEIKSPNNTAQYLAAKLISIVV